MVYFWGMMVAFWGTEYSVSIYSPNLAKKKENPMSGEHTYEDFEKDALFTILSETENLTNVGGWEWDSVKDNWIFSDNWLRIHGCSKRHLVTSELLQIAHPDDRPDVHKAFNSAIAEGNNYEIEHRIIRQDTGEERHIRAHGKSILNSDGKVVKIYGAAQDITEFRQTEKKLRESENKTENLVNNLPGVAYQFLMDKKRSFRFEYMGDNCIKLFGIKADAILSDANLVFDLIPQPDYDDVQKTIMASAETLTPYDIEHRVIKKNGETVWVHAISTPWKNAGGDIVWDGIGLDITKRRQAEKALGEKNQLLKRITENMFDMVSMSDLEGNYTFAGKSHERILGYATSDLIGKNVMDFVHPDDLPKIKKEFQSLLGTGGTKTVQYRNRHNLGHYLWFETIGELLLDNNQNPSEIIFSTRDISEHKKAQAVLEEKEQRYKSAQRMGKVGNWEYDILNNNFWCSDEVKRIYGFDPESQHFTADQVESCITDREKVHQALFDLIEKDKPYDLEFEILPLNESEMKIIKSTAEVVKNGSGKPQKVIGVIQDITAQRLIDEKLRKSEQKYRRLTENSPDTIYRMSLPDGRYEYVNPSAENIFGYPPQTWYDNPLLVREILHPDYLSYFEKQWKNLLKGDLPPSYEYKIIHKDGSVRWINQRNILVKSEDNRPLAIEGILTDMTERKQAEEKIFYLQKSESLGRMAGAVAHHFNNQLSVVMGNLELVLDDLPDHAENRENLLQAFEAARKAADKSGQMLRYLGHVSGNQTTINLSDVCRQTLAFLQAALPNGVNLNIDFPDSGAFVHADTGQIQQVLTNLFTNARESISDNQGSIDLNIQTVSHEDISTSNRFPLDWQPQDILFVCLEISDTGCGMSKENIAKIFDPFFTTKFTGRGMGLSVNIGILKNHSGCITVDSEPGCGSVFRVYLPVATKKP